MDRIHEAQYAKDIRTLTVNRINAMGTQSSTTPLTCASFPITHQSIDAGNSRNSILGRAGVVNASMTEEHCRQPNSEPPGHENSPSTTASDTESALPFRRLSTSHQGIASNLYYTKFLSDGIDVALITCNACNIGRIAYKVLVIGPKEVSSQRKTLGCRRNSGRNGITSQKDREKHQRGIYACHTTLILQ